jgi:hypothetical protein
MSNKTSAILLLTFILAVPILAATNSGTLQPSDVMNFGAKCDVVTATDVAMQVGSNVLTSQQSSFSQADLGKSIVVLGAGSLKATAGVVIDRTASKGHNSVFSYIIQVTDQHIIELANVAQTAVTGGQASWGSDDSAAIQAAINGLGTGGELTFSRICGVGESNWPGLMIDRSQITISGNGVGTGLMTLVPPIWQPANPLSSEPVLLLVEKGMTGVTLENLEIDGSGANANLLGLAYVSSTTIEGLYVHDTTGGSGSCIFSLGGSGNTYDQNRTTLCNRGFWIGNDTALSEPETNATITSNLVNDNYASGLAGTLQDSLINGNIIWRNEGSCIPLGSSPYVVYHDVTISNNTCAYNLWDAVQSDVWPYYSATSTPSFSQAASWNPVTLMAGAPTNITITNNVLEYNQQSGIYGLYARSWTIANNTIGNNNVAGDQSPSGIFLQYAANITIENNNISDATPSEAAGIFVDYYNTINSISSITIEGNAIVNQKGDGLILTSAGGILGSGNSICITDNKIQASGDYGIEINEGYTNITVSDNIASGSGKQDYRGDVAVTGTGNSFGTTIGVPITQ